MKLPRRSLKNQPPIEPGNQVDRSYVSAMKAHLRVGVMLARAAGAQACNEDVRAAGRRMMDRYERELVALDEAATRLTETGVRAGDARAFAIAAGAGATTPPLPPTGSADRIILKALVFHQQDAIAMARRIVERGDNESVRRRAEQFAAELDAECERIRTSLRSGLS